MLHRLYSSAHYNDTFPKHTPPEILNTPLEGVVLLLKAMAVDKVWFLSGNRSCSSKSLLGVFNVRGSC